MNLFQWSYAVKTNAGFKCAILNRRVRLLHSHHLYSKTSFPQLQFILENGIAIDASLHKDFHRNYGRKSTLQDFIHYLSDLELSHNNSFDLARLRKLKHDLSNLKPILENYLTKLQEKKVLLDNKTEYSIFAKKNFKKNRQKPSCRVPCSNFSKVQKKKYFSLFNLIVDLS
jgi:hypothetical protein